MGLVEELSWPEGLWEWRWGDSDLGRGAWDHTPSPFKPGSPRSFVPALEHPRKS